MSTRPRQHSTLVKILLTAVILAVVSCVLAYLLLLRTAVRVSQRHSADHTWRMRAPALVGSDPALTDHDRRVRCATIDELHPALFDRFFDPASPGGPESTVAYRDALLQALASSAAERGDQALAGAYQSILARVENDPAEIWTVNWDAPP